MKPTVTKSQMKRKAEGFSVTQWLPPEVVKAIHGIAKDRYAHLATTTDGKVERFYVNGTLVYEREGIK